MIRFVVAVLLAGVMAGAYPQNEETARDVFQKAIASYTAGDYASTIKAIRSFLKKNGKDPGAEYLVPLIMEAFLRTADYESVNRLYGLYRRKYRSSAYMPRVYYLNGYALAKRDKHGDAFNSFSKALENGVSEDLDTLIIQACEAMCRHVLSEDDLNDACRDRHNHPRVKEIACYYHIEKLIAAGKTGPLKRQVRHFRNKFPGTRFQVAAEVDEPTERDAAQKGTKIGLLAPLSGEDGEVGRRVSQGVQLAIDTYNKKNQQQLALIAYDTKGRLIDAALKTAHLLDNDRVSFIIGPLLSPTATVAAAMARREEVVVLTPTATDEGIAALAPTVFQMNITLGVLSRKAARYALDNLNIKEFAILAQQSTYGMAMAELFREEVEKDGGTIFDEQYYEEGANDFTAHFSGLRKKLILRRLNTIRGLNNRKPKTKLSYRDSIAWYDSTVSIGALFMPGESDDVVMLAPQVAFNRIRSQLIGTSGWYTQKTLTVGKHYVHNAIISTSFEPDTSWKKWPAFRKEFISAYREEPDRIAAMGYDAGSLAAMALEGSGSSKASRIAETLLKTQKYQGTSGVISFDPERRVNTEAVILKITPNGFVRVQ
ncbi:MAG: penicillin-binding protein activator [Chitinispirillaceae bacterium]|nr:penicillin-binding protein activator [Chitinispirillaceae bacterium]